MEINEFVEELKKLGINITDKQLEQLETYYNLLIETNKITNLTRITNKQEVYLKHFYDSLTLIKAYDLTKDLTLCDLGSGAGFPGIVLKIVFPNLNITLVDSLNKRTIFLKQVIKELNLKDINVVTSRIEDYSKNNIESFDILTSRAVAKTNILLELSSQLLKVNGYFLIMKANIEEELKESKNAINKLNYKLIDKIEFNLPKENSKRTILKLKKIDKTDKKYPRDFAKIKKNPL